MQRETIAAASRGAGLLAGEGWRVSVTRMRKRLPRAKHYARHFPHIKGRPGRTGGNETLESRMPARTSEQISRSISVRTEGSRRWGQISYEGCCFWRLLAPLSFLVFAIKTALTFFSWLLEPCYQGWACPKPEAGLVWEAEGVTVPPSESSVSTST